MSDEFNAGLNQMTEHPSLSLMQQLSTHCNVKSKYTEASRGSKVGERRGALKGEIPDSRQKLKALYMGLRADMARASHVAACNESALWSA